MFVQCTMTKKERSKSIFQPSKTHFCNGPCYLAYVRKTYLLEGGQEMSTPIVESHTKFLNSWMIQVGKKSAPKEEKFVHNSCFDLYSL